MKKIKKLSGAALRKTAISRAKKTGKNQYYREGEIIYRVDWYEDSILEGNGPGTFGFCNEDAQRAWNNPGVIVSEG